MCFEQIDSIDFDYMIIYSEKNEPDVNHIWTLPDVSFQMNYKSMIKRECIIHGVFRRMSEKELLNVIVNS